MNNKVLAAIVAGGLLVGAGFVTSIVSAPATATAQEDTDSSEEGPFPRILGFLGDVLDDLVGEGTITEDQADAIADAAQEKAQTIKEERAAEHQLLRDLLEDDVITEEEASELPDDHFLFSERYDEAWEDGELSRDEVRPHSRRDFFKRGLRLGSLLDDGGIDQEEYDSLDEDHPLKQADVSSYLEDGLITPDELRQAHQDLHDARSDEDA